jgi:hypothetical protein
MKTKSTHRNLKSVVAGAVLALLAVSLVLLPGSAAARAKKMSYAKSAAEQAIAENTERANQNWMVQPKAPKTSVNYGFSTSTSGSFTNMTGSTQLVGAGQDDFASPNTPIGFDFWLLGNRYTQFNATSNGSMGLSSTGTTVTSTTYNIIGGSTTTPRIAAMAGDLETAAGVGKVHYKVTGSAPNRVLTVEFLNMSIVYNGTSGDGTYQVRLHETTGQIEFVYGAMNRNSATGLDGNSGNLDIGFATAAANGALVSILSASNTATTTTPFTEQSYPLSSPIANLNTPSDGSRRVYSLTPPSVTPAGGPLTFSAITPIAMTLNWIDSPDETNYAIYRSTDNVTFTFAGTAPLNATSFVATGLSPSTNYFWQVYAISDGSVSTALTSSQMTTAPGVVTSTASGGLWSQTTTWAGGVLPTSTDDVTIVGGATVTIDTAAVALDVTVNSGGALLWDTASARTLTTGLNLTIASGGSFTSGATGTVTTHVLSVGGNLINNGTLNFSTNGNTAGAGITFTTGTNNTFGGTGGTTNIRTMTLNKVANSNVLELNPTNFTVQGVNTDVAGFLTITSGTLKISGTFTMTNRTFAIAGYSIPAAGGFWLNNPNYTVAGQAGNGTITGLFRLTQGTYNQGTASNNVLNLASNSTTIIEGGTLTAASRLAVSAAGNTVNYTQTGGTITVCTIGNTSTTLGNFDLGTSAGSLVTMSGGTIIIRLHSSGIDYRYDADPSNLTGTTVQLGDASSGAAKAFSLRGVLPNLVITNTSGNHTATFNNTLVNFYHVITGNVTINTGTTLSLAGDATSILTFFEGNILNNGTLNASNANMSVEMVATGLQTYSGTGIMTAPTTVMEVDGGGVDFTGAVNQQVISRINLYTGGITGANKITLGNGGATAAFIQIGNGGPPALTTGPVTGTIVNNAGSGGYSIFYGDVDADRSTGGEIPAGRTVTNATFDSEGPNVTIAGGDLTVTGATTFGDPADTASNGRVITGANNLIIGSVGTVTRVGGLGHVDGNLVKNFATNTALTFESGTANGYSPVMVNMTAGAPAPFMVKSTQLVQPNIPNPTMALQRYWTLTATGVTADLTFNYLDPTDIPGTANESNFVIFKYDGSLTMPGGSVNTGANTATITGVTSFSDWTLAEPAPAAPVLTSAVSELTHGGAGTFDVNMPLSGTPGVEDRSAGIYSAVLTFTNGPITSGTATVTAGTGTAGSPTFSGNTMTVPLTGVGNAQTITLTVNNVNGVLPTASVNMSFLIGDTNADGTVNSADIGQTKSQSGAPVTGANFREDVNVDGNLNSGDIGLVKSKSGTALP